MYSIFVSGISAVCYKYSIRIQDVEKNVHILILHFSLFIIIEHADRTFGKGKIQSVFELNDGSAVFVTVAKYKTPGGEDIDQVGVRPDLACSNVSPGGPRSVPGIPVGPGADKLVIEELETDACVLTAENILSKHPGKL